MASIVFTITVIIIIIKLLGLSARWCRAHVSKLPTHARCHSDKKY